jgi:hypothetical protein
MLCPERQRLLINHRDTVQEYAGHVRDFVERVGLEVGESQLLRIRCAEAWERAEKARVALSRHEANHFCDRPDFMREPVKT